MHTDSDSSSNPERDKGQCISHHHHHHVVPPARISLTLSRHFSPSFIAYGWSSGLHPVSSDSCRMYVRADRSAFARLYVGAHKSTSLMSSSLLLQQCPACLVRLTWIVSWWEVGGRIVGVLGGVAAWTCSILLAALLCNCRLASSPTVLLASMSCIHTAISIRQLPARDCVSLLGLKYCVNMHIESTGHCKYLVYLNTPR